jgi:hypothetical protein
MAKCNARNMSQYSIHENDELLHPLNLLRLHYLQAQLGCTNLNNKKSSLIRNCTSYSISTKITGSVSMDFYEQ